MSYSIIAAIGKNRELGKDNDLIWHLKDDMKYFRETTTGHTIIMGGKTFASLPKVLPNRENVVLSSKDNYPNEVKVFHDIDSLLEYYKDSKDEIFIIGGSSIYKIFIDYADKLYLTEIDESCNEASVYFPKFIRKNYNKKVISNNEENDIKYKFVIYEKKTQ